VKDGVKLNQEHIIACRLLKEIVDIKKIPNLFERAMAIQQWGDEVESFVEKISQPCAALVLTLVQEERRQPLRNCDDVNQQA
jgi:hypothetical protein